MRALVFLLGLSSALAALQTTTDVIAAVDKSFLAVDTNDDSVMELYELTNSYLHLDANNDGKISEFEFESRSTNHTYTRVVFLELDHDQDGYLDMSSVYGQYSIMDANTDNIVSRAEFDNYYTTVIKDAVDNYGHLVGLAPIQK
ncbi:uncharacterized protein LOC132563078 [Ylistrum balloti]|uniref:uncharacterized protein LOC132563078 n=1 Tax=Ylistrum balloti TaxID=509963 RepID=UPI0029059850|nr:uncharacterized protein LOC132563078 [Ylistrum balloti]